MWGTVQNSVVAKCCTESRTIDHNPNSKRKANTVKITIYESTA